ncbi:hypothetical protein BC940DRAFT_166102 [Gongronella butleri]|nr:hypothetical protein BC940DRAFT_166102 [Gongronella butleri]
MSPTHGPGSTKKTRLTPSKSAEVSPSVQHLQVTMTAVTGTTTPSSSSSSSQTNHHKHQTTDKVAEVSTSDAGSETASSSPQLRASSSPNSSPGKTSAAGKAAAAARPFRQKFIKSPLFQQADKATCGSPGLSPMTIAALTPTVVDTAIPSLPPPVQDGRSEAIAALQDAANGSVKTKSGGVDAQTSSGTTGSSANLAASLSAATSGQLAPPTHQLPHQAMSSSSSSAPHAMQECASTAARIFDSSFFSVVMLVHWSNVVGPKVKKVWSADPVDDQLLITIARQVLNGEMGRELSGIEPKWLVLHRQGLICAAFLFQEPVSLCLSALVMVVPVRYLRNFAQYFSILAHRIPTELIDVIIHLRKASRRLNIITLAIRIFFPLFNLSWIWNRCLCQQTPSRSCIPCSLKIPSRI